MMIFASDLDQTLIYSRKSFRSAMNECNIQLIETFAGRDITFMTHRAIKLLKEIASKALFVPVTTRTMEQYQRISLFQKDIVPEFAVTSNGGVIIRNGDIDESWSKVVHSKLANCMAKEEIFEKFQEIYHQEWVVDKKIVDDLFCRVVVVQDKIPNDELQSFYHWLEAQQWTYSLQGRKLFFVPQSLNKWAAVEYIKQIANEGVVIAAGDSLLDLCMLENADYAFAPLHGELHKRKVKRVIETNEEGLLASEEILLSVLHMISEKSYSF